MKTMEILISSLKVAMMIVGIWTMVCASMWIYSHWRGGVAVAAQVMQQAEQMKRSRQFEQRMQSQLVKELKELKNDDVEKVLSRYVKPIRTRKDSKETK